VRFAGCLVLSCLVAAASARAHADNDTGDTYAIVSIQIAGDADPALRGQIESAILRGLRKAKMNGVAQSEVQQATRGKPELAGCVTTACLDKIGAIVGANQFLSARVETRGAAFTVLLEVLGSDRGARARREASCPVCTLTELAELISERTRELVSDQETESIELAVTSRPAGAEIFVSEGAGKPPRSLGRAPLKASLPAGSYIVEARLDGHVAARQSVRVGDSGESQALELVLLPEGGSAGPYKWAKWGAAGGAAAALAAGTTLLILDGNGTCDVAGRDNCPRIYATAGAGVAALIGGIVLGGASGWMFWREGNAEGGAHAAIRPTGTGAELTIAF